MLTMCLGFGIVGYGYAKGYPDINNFSIDEIYDGDTIYVTFPGVPDVLGKHIGVRLLGTDTPEMHSKLPCLHEMAIMARQELVTFIGRGKTLTLTKVKRDKFFRLDADLLVNGESASEHMLKGGWAKSFTGQTAKAAWTCPLTR